MFPKYSIASLFSIPRRYRSGQRLQRSWENRYICVANYKISAIMLPADLYIHFICPSEQLMFRTRESMSPQLRQLDVRYRTDKSYPPECYRFELSIPAVEEYTMTFRVWIVKHDPRIEQILTAAHNVVESVSTEIRLEIER